MKNFHYKNIEKKYDRELGDLIRHILKDNKLDIEGTAYFDDMIYSLSEYYLSKPDRRYYTVLTDDDDNVIGGIGFAELNFIEDCAELQKLYLSDAFKGNGIGYEMIKHIEEKAKDYGYKRIYLETHSNLKSAIHIYEKSGYKLIERPSSVEHSAMDRFFIKELV